MATIVSDMINLFSVVTSPDKQPEQKLQYHPGDPHTSYLPDSEQKDPKVLPHCSHKKHSHQKQAEKDNLCTPPKSPRASPQLDLVH